VKGFFEASEVREKDPRPMLLPQCGACKLLKQCRSPLMEVSGEGAMGILVVGEAPGQHEDEQGVQFVGESGQVLRSALSHAGVDLDRDCWKTNALVCRPPKNRKPTQDEINYCRPNLIKTIETLKPRHIIPLGAAATSALLSPLWRENIGIISQWVGWHIPLQKWNCWVTPTYHPSFVLRSKEDKSGKVIKVWFERHLEQALTLSGRPWKKIPDYPSQVRVIEDPRVAAALIRGFIEKKHPCSFDYETNRLKPDPDNARIVTAAISRRGEETIAYPFLGEAVDATGEFLRSDLPKIGANTKFEDRWTIKQFGHRVNNWVWDGMNNAHILDNRRHVTSVEFQAFVRLGFEPWSYHIKPFLSNAGLDGLNRIYDIKLTDLLMYGGLDALVEYHVGVHQRKEALG